MLQLTEDNLTMTKKNSEGLRILMAEGVSQPHTEATPGEILRCAQDDTGADNGTQPGTEATAREILRCAQDDKLFVQDDTGATAREILRCAQDDKYFVQDDKLFVQDHMMADDGTQPGTDATEASTNGAEAGDETTNGVDEEDTAKMLQQAATSAGGSNTPSTVIWTPRFMVIFALTLAMG